MNLFVSNQMYVFGLSLLMGLGLGISYDVLRILRRIIPHPKFVVGIEDLLFWIAAAFMVFKYIFEANDGSMRGFIFIGICLGLILYTGLFSPLVMKVADFLLSWLARIAKPFKIILRPLFFMTGKTRKGLKKSSRWVIIRMKKLLKDIYIIRKKV